MPISRVTAQWSGFPGAPGYSNFHFQSSTGTPDNQANVDLVRSFFQAARDQIAAGVTITVNPTVEVLDDATGALVDYDTVATAPAVVLGGASGNYSGPSGAVINWLTNAVVGGRRLRGRTFLVPLGNSAYQSDGTLGGTSLASLNTAAALLSGAGFSSGFGILSRPAGGGAISFGEVTAHRIPDMAAVLRSRRD
jgi:hypothetical protein